MKQYRVGVLGATGTVGQRFVILLKNHSWFKITELGASENSKGEKYEEAVKSKWILDEPIPEGIKNIILKDAVNDSREIAKNVDFVFCALSLTKEEILKLEEHYAKLECPVISNNSANRMVPDVPMVLPEVNANHIDIIPFQKKRLGTKKGFIAVKPNCSLQCYVPALYPLLKLGIESVTVCTYQAISGAGKTFKTFPEMVDNIIPYIPGEEEKSENEPLKIFGTINNGKVRNNQNIKISAQCFRVPVTNGHSAGVFVNLRNKVPVNEIKDLWENYQNPISKLNLPSAPNKFLTYFEEPNRPQIKLERTLENGMGVSVGRLRYDSFGTIKFVSMSHNTVRGAAGGAILLAELLCKMNYIY